MYKKIKCDVLVIGAGVAGMRAVVAAQQKGAKVLLVTKGKIGTSGASAYTVTEASGFGVADGYRCKVDNPDVHFADIMRAGHGMCDEAVVRTLVTKALETIQELEDFGVEFERESDGSYLVSQGCFGSVPRNYNLTGHGTKIIQALKTQLNEQTIVLEDNMIADLIVRDGRCIGAAAISKDGKITLISAGAIILASGGASSMFKFALNPPEMTGDSYALGYLAGAKLMNMEFMQVGMGVLAPGKSILNSWIWSIHPDVTDGEGKAVFPEVFPDGMTLEKVMDAKAVHYPFSSESASRNIEIFMQRAIVAGKGSEYGGVRMDAREALKSRKAGNLQLFEDMWGLTNRWFLSRGIDVEKEPMEIACFAHAINGGIKINSCAETSLLGLYAAGEASAGAHGADRLGGNMLMTCVVYGKIAGECAAEEALGQKCFEISDYIPLKNEGSGKNAKILMKEIQLYMLNDMLVIRSEEKCHHLRTQLDRIKKEAMNASFENMDAYAPYNLRNMIITAYMMLEAVEARKESRGSHFREDYPQENPEYNRPYIIQKT